MKQQSDILTKALDDMEEICELTHRISQDTKILRNLLAGMDDFQEALENWHTRLLN